MQYNASSFNYYENLIKRNKADESKTIQEFTKTSNNLIEKCNKWIDRKSDLITERERRNHFFWPLNYNSRRLLLCEGIEDVEEATIFFQKIKDLNDEFNEKEGITRNK